MPAPTFVYVSLRCCGRQELPCYISAVFCFSFAQPVAIKCATFTQCFSKRPSDSDRVSVGVLHNEIECRVLQETALRLAAARGVCHLQREEELQETTGPTPAKKLPRRKRKRHEFTLARLIPSPANINLPSKNQSMAVLPESRRAETKAKSRCTRHAFLL